MQIPVAHAGHWLPYVIPVAVVLVAVVVTSVRERRRREAAPADGGEAEKQPEDPVQPSD